MLKYGLNYSIEIRVATYITNLAADTEQAIRFLDDKLQNTYRFMATKKLKKNHKLSKPDKHTSKRTVTYTEGTEQKATHT